MNQRTRLEIIQHNERIKAWSSIVGNLGLLLIGATAGLIYAGKASDDLLGWALVGVVLALMSGAMMHLLEDDA